MTLEISWESPGAGALGFVHAVHAMSRPWRAAEGSLEEWLCVSSVAFAHYVFDPALNLEPAFSPLGLFFTNYGVFEALSHYTAIALQEVNHLPEEQLWQVLGFEAEQGRPVLSVGFGGPLQPVLILELRDEGPGTRFVQVLRASGEVEEVSMWGVSSSQGDSEDFNNWALLVRPGIPPDWTIPLGRQRLNTLRWALSHARNAQEFFHETRHNYATRLRGFELLERWATDIPAHPTFPAYLEEHLRTIARARRAAALVLPMWAQELPEQPGVVTHDVVAARSALVRAGEAYQEVSDALTQANLSRASESEARAVEALALALDQFPVVM